jgi:hypothetical protein
MSLPFGTMISEPFGVRMMLARMPICSTTPEASSICTTSPILTGRSKSRISPETKLLNMFCRPKPTPTLNAPARIVTFVISKPSAATAAKKPAEQDDVVKNRRDRVRQAAAERDARIDVFVEQKAHEAGHEKRRPHGERECEHVADGKVQRADSQVSGEDALDRVEQPVAQQ